MLVSMLFLQLEARPPARAGELAREVEVLLRVTSLPLAPAIRARIAELAAY